MVNLDGIRTIAADFAADRATRQQRRTLDADDFARLHDAGLTRTGVPACRGGHWHSVRESARPVCDAYRALARGDSCVALVASMHPAVLSYWLTAPDDTATAGWDEQCEFVFESAKAGHWWGTITSEPGSGGDIARSRAEATPSALPLDYRLSGAKHFGSGSGQTSFMVTTAVPSGDDEPDWFFVDVRNARWNGEDGLSLLGEWDGHGMAATQSHSIQFENFPATRLAWSGHLLDVGARAGGFIGCLFSAVITGIVDEAMHTARGIFRGKNLGSFEDVAWSRAQTDHWMIHQALDGMLRAVETKQDPRLDVLTGKTAIAERAESILLSLCRALGGSTFSRRSPFGHWFEDVRALGFLRPPWALAYETLANLRRESD